MIYFPSCKQKMEGINSPSYYNSEQGITTSIHLLNDFPFESF